MQVLPTLRKETMGGWWWSVCVICIWLACDAMGAPPRRPVDVPFGRNYYPTWAFDHIKYLNGGSQVQLHLDKYTGILPAPTLSLSMFSTFHGSLFIL